MPSQDSRQEGGNGNARPYPRPLVTKERLDELHAIIDATLEKRHGKRVHQPQLLIKQLLRRVWRRA